MPALSVVTFSPGRANLSAACAAVCSARGLKSWPPESHARAATNTAPRVEVSLGGCLHELLAGYGLAFSEAGAIFRNPETREGSKGNL